MPERLLFLCAAVALAVFAVLQMASSAIFASAGSPQSVPAHLRPAFGEAVYSGVEKVFPARYVEAMLVRAALDRGDLNAAELHLARMAPSVGRSELAGRVALARNSHNDAMRNFLDADDLDALHAEVRRLTGAGQLRAAYDFENAIRARLARTATHPDAIADSFWRSGVLASALAVQSPALRAHWLLTGLQDYRDALSLAPFSEKYLLAAGTQSLDLHLIKAASEYFERSVSADPASADAYAGLGVVALERGDRQAAQTYAARSRSYDAKSQMLARLDRELQ
ncbi:MAG: hypothetical protein M3N19_01155 [Candidatus Eremiobacteraeota bacterium]|nr:hypothetical protein [Candidatus Eremiobacteraeota bacterium]